MINFFRILVVFVSLGLLSNIVMADDVYDVANIKVNSSGKDGIDAKQKAMAKAEAKAVVILFDRLLTSGQKKKALKRLDRDTRSLLVKGFSVKNEQSGGTQYIAEITIKFRKTAVQRYLASMGAQYSDSQSDISILIPILTDASGNSVIWSAQNAWSEALAAHDLKNSLMPLKIPNSSEAGLLATEQEVIDKNENAIYQLSSIVLEGAQTVFAHMSLTATTATLQVSGLTNYSKKYTIKNGNLNAVYTKAANEFLKRLVSSWRNNNITSKPRLAAIKALVVFGDFNQWIAIRRQLNQVSAISEYDTAVTTAEGTFIDIKHKGSIATLATEMEQNGLLLIDLGAYFEIRG